MRKKTCWEEKEEEEVVDKLHNEIIAVILPPPRIRPGKRIRVTSVTRWRPVQKKTTGVLSHCNCEDVDDNDGGPGP